MIQIKNSYVKFSNYSSRGIKINLDIMKGDFCMFIGPNGCGKTTFFDLIAGVRSVETGEVKINSELPLGYAVQDITNGLLPWKNILNNILLPSQLFTDDLNNTYNKAIDLLNNFNFSNRIYDYPYQLSGGEKQIINFIRTICTPADIFLFDEIFSALHLNFKNISKDILCNDLKNKTTLFITHDAEDINLPFNRFFQFSDNGVLIEISKVDAIKELRDAK